MFLKTISVVFWCLIALLLLQSDLVSAEEQFPFVAETVSDLVNVRASQSPDFESLYQARIGTKFVVVGKLYSWYKVELPMDAVVYVAAKYVQLCSDNTEGVITGDKVNVRAKQDVDGTAVGRVLKGDKISVLKVALDWLSIRPPSGSFGWVKIDSLKFISQDVEGYKKTLSPVLKIAPEELKSPLFCPLPEKPEPTVK
ncbi:MAG: hypothetical protein HQL25_07400 [Candidatus Omnitrophica bacterium]|nr:hypothetical protein [Candidatus Omnitrophota bacterium]